MSSTTKYALTFAVLFALVKFFIFKQQLYLSGTGEIIKYGALTLFLLIVVFLSINTYSRTNGEESNILVMLKEGMKSASVYALLVGVFTYFYYNKIHPEFGKEKYEAYIAMLESKTWEEITENNQQLKEVYKSKEAYIQDQAAGVKDVIYSSKMTVPLTILGVMLLGFFYSFFVSVLFKRLLLR